MEEQFLREWRTERDARYVAWALAEGIGVPISEPTHCRKVLEHGWCQEAAVIEDRARGERGLGMELCARHYCERNGR